MASQRLIVDLLLVFCSQELRCDERQKCIRERHKRLEYACEGLILDGVVLVSEQKVKLKQFLSGKL